MCIDKYRKYDVINVVVQVEVDFYVGKKENV